MGWEILLGIGLALFAFAWWIARKAVPEPPSPVPPMPPPVPPPGTRQRISIIVRSPSYPAADVAAYIIAQQAQISHEFAPAFGMDAEIVLEDAAVVTGWPVFLDETSDLAGALGYHDVNAAGAPFARVFLADSRAAGVAWQSVASHEVVEMLADPTTTRTAVGPNGRPWSFEVGDPCEDVDYLINGVPMSDFVFPRWFAPGYTGQVDNRHALLRAFQVTPGGYAQFEAADGSWVQISGPSGRKARK